MLKPLLCGSRKYPYSPHRRDWKFQGGGGVSKTQKFKAMYEAKMEFPEGWGGGGGGGGVIGKIPSVGGYGYFLEPHIVTKPVPLFGECGAITKHYYH